MVSEDSRVRCPRCDRVSTPRRDGLYFCEQCRMLHDDDPNEGGSYTSQNPERSAISKEEYELRQRARFRPRRGGGR